MSQLKGLDLKLPQALVPELILSAPPVPVIGEYFRATRAGKPLDVSLPRPPARTDEKRFSPKGVFDGLYLGSSQKTVLMESWTAKQDFRVDVYSIEVRLNKVFDLRLGKAKDLLASNCFGLAKPPDRTHRNYVATQYLGYGVWSAGFEGIVWASERYAGDVICVFDVGPTSGLGRPGLVEKNVLVKKWLKENP